MYIHNALASKGKCSIYILKKLTSLIFFFSFFFGWINITVLIVVEKTQYISPTKTVAYTTIMLRRVGNFMTKNIYDCINQSNLIPLNLCFYGPSISTSIINYFYIVACLQTDPSTAIALYANHELNKSQNYMLDYIYISLDKSTYILSIIPYNQKLKK